MINHPNNNTYTLPHAVLAYHDSSYALACSRFLRDLGWEVHLTRAGYDARRLTRLYSPQLVILDTKLSDESGWLTCAKLRFQYPHQTVIFVTDEVDREKQAFADFLGAAGLVDYEDPFSEIMDKVELATRFQVACA